MKNLPDMDDLIKELAILKKESEKYKRIAKALQKHTETWICPDCENVIIIEEIPDTDGIKCQLCEKLMMPYSAYQYETLTNELELLNDKLSLVLKERDDYAGLIRSIIPVAEKHGYNKKEGNLKEFLERTLDYQEILELKILKQKNNENME